MNKVSKNIEKPITLQGFGFAKLGDMLIAVCGERTINPNRGERVEWIDGILRERREMAVDYKAVLYGEITYSGGIAYLKDAKGQILMQSGDVEGVPCGLLTDGTTVNVMRPFVLTTGLTMAGEEATIAAIASLKVSVSM